MGYLDAQVSIDPTRASTDRPTSLVRYDPSMRVRILLTDGDATADLFWISHDGTDVYYGSPTLPFKRSYHASGKIHTAHNDGEKTDGVWHVPLQQIRGQFHLSTLSFINDRHNIKERVDLYSGRKSDAVLLIDSRSIPKGQRVSVIAGLLEPGNGAFLGRMIATETAIGLETKQVLLATAVTPWVYIQLSWPTARFDAMFSDKTPE